MFKKGELVLVKLLFSYRVDGYATIVKESKTKGYYWVAVDGTTLEVEIDRIVRPEIPTPKNKVD